MCNVTPTPILIEGPWLRNSRVKIVESLGIFNGQAKPTIHFFFDDVVDNRNFWVAFMEEIVSLSPKLHLNPNLNPT